MIKHYYYAETKKNVEYVIELCACSSYLSLKRYWLDENDVPSELWVGTYRDAKTCVEKAKIDFDYSFNKKEYQMTVECPSLEKYSSFDKNVNEKELYYAE